MPIEIALTQIQLQLTRPEEADMRKIHHYALERGADAEEVSYIVKLYIKTPLPQDGMGVELYIGDVQIRRYFQFKNGIYFKVNDRQKLSTLRGKEVRFHRPGTDEFINTGVKFPVDEKAEVVPPKATGAFQLPTQEEVLRE